MRRDLEDRLSDRQKRHLKSLRKEQQGNDAPEITPQASNLVAQIRNFLRTEITSSQTDIRIRDIQGTGLVSRLDGHEVNNVPGIVTNIVANGFYLGLAEKVFGWGVGCGV